jgi:hypothetical protein
MKAKSAADRDDNAIVSGANPIPAPGDRDGASKLAPRAGTFARARPIISSDGGALIGAQ